MYSVQLEAEAAKSFENADASFQRRLNRCFDMLKIDPRRHNNIKPLHGRLAGFWRYRAGDYRVVYRIDDAASSVRVAAIVHRREAYE